MEIVKVLCDYTVCLKHFILYVHDCSLCISCTHVFIVGQKNNFSDQPHKKFVMLCDVKIQLNTNFLCLLKDGEVKDNTFV